MGHCSSSKDLLQLFYYKLCIPLIPCSFYGLCLITGPCACTVWGFFLFSIFMLLRPSRMLLWCIVVQPTFIHVCNLFLNAMITEHGSSLSFCGGLQHLCLNWSGRNNADWASTVWVGQVSKPRTVHFTVSVCFSSYRSHCYPLTCECSALILCPSPIQE